MGSTGKERRICAANESTLSTADAVPLPHAGKAYKVSQSPVIPLISGEWIISHAWYEILRLSFNLFRLGLFTHRAFLSAQDDDTRGRKGSHLGDTLHVLELAVLYYDTSSPLETEVPQRDFRVWPNPKRRLACPLRRLPVRPNGPRQRRRMDPRGGVKDYVRLPVFHLSSRPKWRDPSRRPVNRG